MQFKSVPVVVSSSIAGRGSELAVEALNIGAMEVVDKPMSALARQRLGPTLRAALRAAVATIPRARTAGSSVSFQGSTSVQLIAIGASTGGPAQLFDLLPRLPKNLPPIGIVQHMPEGFTAAFADRLARRSGHNVREADGSEVLVPGMIRVAPGSKHLIAN